MKKFLLTALFVLIASLAFAQERIAIFPFEDRDNLYTLNQLDLYYREFSSEFKNKTDERRFTVISRVDVEKIIDMEQKFQLTRYSSKEITAEMERVLNPKQVLYILIVKDANNIRINVSRLSFPEMEVLRGGRGITITNKNQILEKIPELVQIMLTAMGGEEARPDVNSPPPSAQTYKIGDTGPAGGIVFFDRGFTGDGWRYLEAAPAGSEFTAQWGAYEKDVANTITAVGFGKQNTQIIVERLKTLGETNKAAQICAALDINGYKDWFLPSMDELDLMYKNLKQKGLGGFGNVWYWSSSQGNINIAWGQRFSDGHLDIISKYPALSVRAVRAFGVTNTTNKTGISIEGYTFTERNRQTVIYNFRDTVQALKLNLDIDEKTNPAAGYGFTITIDSEPFVSYGASMIRYDVTVTFSLNGRLLCRSAPYKIIEPDENRLVRLLSEELKADKAFFDKVKESIK